jgi:hypothetical protein
MLPESCSVWRDHVLYRTPSIAAILWPISSHFGADLQTPLLGNGREISNCDSGNMCAALEEMFQAGGVR